MIIGKFRNWFSIVLRGLVCFCDFGLCVFSALGSFSASLFVVSSLCFLCFIASWSSSFTSTLVVCVGFIIPVSVFYLMFSEFPKVILYYFHRFTSSYF